MPQAKQRSQRSAGRHRPQYGQSSNPGVRLTEEGIEAFLDTCREMGQLELEDDPQPELTRTEYLRLLQTARALGKEKVYLLIKLFGSTSLTVQELPKVTVEAVEAGRIPIVFSGVRSVVRLPELLRKELLEYAKRCGYLSGPIFLTRNGAPLNRTYVSASIRSICADARVPREKGNPRCLKRLYQSTKSGIEDNISLLVEQAMDRLLEQEQLAVGWEEG